VAVEVQARNDTKPLVTAIVLAAGAGLRMGRVKQLLPLGGKPLVRGVIEEAMRSRADEIVVVLGAHADEILATDAIPDSDRVRVVINPEHASGLASSLRTGLQAAGEHSGAAVILLGDQPGVGSALVDRLLESFAAGDRPIVRPAFVAADGRRTLGHPVVIARSLWPDLCKLQGDEGARALLAHRPELLEVVCVSAEAPQDVDTWDDYQKVQASVAAAEKAGCCAGA
jgi:molybdenum cofactor cytidylyltransferase